ncbi:MAG TPA: hypothetical protein VF188_01155 [Longimicrobiales bacterium]
MFAGAAVIAADSVELLFLRFERLTDRPWTHEGIWEPLAPLDVTGDGAPEVLVWTWKKGLEEETFGVAVLRPDEDGIWRVWTEIPFVAVWGH